jgi:hypothetical protein
MITLPVPFEAFKKKPSQVSPKTAFELREISFTLFGAKVLLKLNFEPSSFSKFLIP